MSTPATNALLAPPDRGPRSPRSESPPGDSPFAALLESDRARTAPAEGPHKTDTPRRTRAADRDDTPRPADAGPEAPSAAETTERPAPAGAPDAAPATEDAPVEVDLALLGPALPVTPIVVAAAAEPAAVAVPVVAGAEPPAVPVSAVPAAEPVDTAAAPVAGGARTAQAAQAASAALPGDAAPTLVAEDAVATTDEAESARSDRPAAEPPTAGRTPRGSEEHRRDGRGDTPAPVPVRAERPAEPAARAATASSPAPVPGDREAQPAAAQTAPVAATRSEGVVVPQNGPASTPAAPATPAARGAVPLHQAVATVEAALELAARRGITHARLQLHPAELGAIEIHLRHHAHGLTARLVADSAEALAVLQQGGDDLRKALESAGLGGLELDFGTRGEEGRAFAQQARDDAAREGRDLSRRRGRAGDQADGEAPTGRPMRVRLPLPGSALLDVIA